VRRQIDLGDDLDVVSRGDRLERADVVAVVGLGRRKARELRAVEAERVVLAQVQVDGVELVPGSGADQLLDIGRLVVLARRVDHHAALGHFR